MTPYRAVEVEELLPGFVAFELWGDGDPAWLDEAELPLVENAVPGRVKQFAAGRHCARLALTELGVEPAAILRSSGRCPVWPPTFIGSISHTDGYAVAVVARRSPGVASAGVDAERVGRVGEDLHRRLFLEAERAWLVGLSDEARAASATELFGLKESYYKAQFPLTGAWVGFHDVRVQRSGDHWSLTRATDLGALDEIRWPCTGHTLVRRGVAVSLVGVASNVQATILSE